MLAVLSQLTRNVTVTFAKSSKLVTSGPNFFYKRFANVIFRYSPVFNVYGCRWKAFLPTKHLSSFPNSIFRLYGSYEEVSE